MVIGVDVRSVTIDKRKLECVYRDGIHIKAGQILSVIFTDAETITQFQQTDTEASDSGGEETEVSPYPQYLEWKIVTKDFKSLKSHFIHAKKVHFDNGAGNFFIECLLLHFGHRP